MSKLKWLEPSERQIQDAILHFLSYQKDLLACEITTSARWDPKIHCYRKLGKYVLPGTADIILSVKGLFVAMEVKTQQGRQSSEQKAFQTRVESSGGYYFIVRSLKDAEEAIAQVKNGT